MGFYALFTKIYSKNRREPAKKGQTDMWRSLIDKFSGKDRKRGYTMAELLAVVAIIAVVSALVITGIVAISRTLKFKQRNDYAKTVFLAAQANLSEMRSDGSLFKLQANCDSEEVPQGHCGFPDAEWSYEYVFASSEFPAPEGNTRSAFDTVLPVNSVESVVRKRNIIIEYNPLTGNVFAVFYCSDEILSQYREGTLPRDEEARRELMLGYYDGSGLSSSELDLESSEAYMVFDSDGEEGILTVKVPVSESYYAHLNEFMEGLSIELTLTGENFGGTIGPFMVDVSNGKIDVDGKTVMFDYTLDSLKDLGSFANLAAIDSEKNLSDYLDESEFVIKPGDNVRVKAIIDFNGEIEVDVDDAFLVFNPMFDELMSSGTEADDFELRVSNGRHLQNLNALAPCVADRVSTVSFSDDIYWNETVDYYNNKYGMNVEGQGKVYRNTAAENPCRGLPYFVPIHNEYLFGTATFRYPEGNTGNSGIWDFIGDVAEGIFGPGSQITVAIKGNERVPTLTDELEALTPDGAEQSIAQGHAKIVGFNKRVYYLNIDSTKYTVPNVGETSVSEDGVALKLDGTYYATGVRQVVDYQLTGLFGYINTYISDLHVVNPIVKGHTFVDTPREVPVWGIKWNGLIPEYTITGYENEDVQSNPATGALVGAAGYNTWVVNCSVYLDTEDAYFNRAYMTHGDYVVNADQNWYGVSGKGAVGGLIGYAKSHRTTNKTLDDNDLHLAFRNCFAAVNVSGVMRGNETKHYGYSNGVGGLIGNSQLTNFFNCYASGNVKADGLYLSKTGIGEVVNNDLFNMFGIHLDLPYNGRTSIGVGGFVGTSHGTRYTRCFATGNVAGYGAAKYGAGGFVGIMSLDESFSYGNDNGTEAEIAQTTILTECYAVGRATCNGESGENFSGANARVNFNLNQTASYITNDYYRLYAPMYSLRGTEPKYEDLYIFRDSYYLSDYYKASQENSNNCATAELYSTFQNLVAAHQNANWREDHIDKIKESPILFAIFILKPSLNNTYKGLYAEGYQTGWGPATEATTHSYSMNAAGARYPFTKLENLDYYGDWPGVPSSAGLAYYETYLEEDGTESDIRIYFDRDNTSELSNDPNTMVYRDGYAVLTAGKGVVKVEVGGKTFELRGKKVDNTNQYTPDDEYEPNDAFYPGDDTYHVYLMTDEIMEAAMQESIKTGEFYVKVTITDPQNTSKKYVTYFNPAVALTQVNPVKDSSNENSSANYNAVKPSSIPSQLNVRSARQLAALSRNKVLWGEDFHYVQQFHIDAEAYKWPEGTSMEIGSIGNDNNVFKGTYQGSGGYVTQAKITGFEPTKGFFGSVANTGKIINLDITVGELTVGSKNDANVGILAGSNGGIIDNVDLKIEGDVTLTAKNAAGLLVGRNVGSSAGSDKLYPASITNCTVTGQNAAINANNAGGLVGEAKGENRLNLTSFTDNVVKFTELTSTGGMVGGMFGSAEMVTVTNSNVETRLNAENALYAGGFAGGLYDGTVTTMVVTLTGDSSAEGTLAGLVGYAAGTNFTAADLEFKNTDSLTADVVAGAFGVADSVNVKNSSIDLKNKDLNGTSGAAGYAYQILGDSVIQMVNVPLTGGSVTATEGKAAGFAVENAGSIASSVVKLGAKPEEGKKSNAVPITGGTEAVGFAGAVSGSISNCSVSGSGSITATAKNGRAAGFAGDVTGSIGLSYVTPAIEDTKEAYKDNSNTNLPVKAATVAGFALSVGEDGEISGSYTLCELKGDAYGFAVSNAGTISESTSNVTQTGGISFVGDHTGWINNCYGWYGNDDVTNMVPCVGEDSDGKITSSYFVNIDNREGLADVYSGKGEHSTALPEQISTNVLNKGNTANYDVWVQDNNTYKTFAYDTELKPKYYPYPRLRDHHGDWVRGVQYAYGVVYYEKYTGGEVELAYTIKDLSDPNETVEGELNNFQPLDVKSVPLQGNDHQIVETGYILFYNKDKERFSEDLLGDVLDEDHPICEAMGPRYICVELETEEPVVTIQAQVDISSGEGGQQNSTKICVVPDFADAIVPSDNRIYKVRTAEQLSHVCDEAYAGAKFVQNHDIETEKLAHIGTFRGIYETEDGNEIRANSAPNGWIDRVTGESSMSLYRLAVDEVGKKDNIFGEIEGTVEINQLDVKDASGVLVDTIFGTLTGDTINIGTEIKQNLVGTIKSGGTLSDFTINSDTTSVSMVNELNAGSKISGVTVKIPTIVVKDETDIFGVVAVNVPEKASIIDTTVRTDAIEIEDLTATVGGLVGVNAGTISGGRIRSINGDAPVFITLGDDAAEDDRILTVGGLVGENSGKIEKGTEKKSSAKVEINYSQVITELKEVEEEPVEGEKEPVEGEDEPVVGEEEPVEGENEPVEGEGEPAEGEKEPVEDLPKQPQIETIAIGGLVGANSGIINDASATGFITTNIESMGKTFILGKDGEMNTGFAIGGAVGFDNVQVANDAAEYENVTAAVTMDVNLATQDEVTADSPSGKGSVGTFVGYANCGSFISCSSTDAENAEGEEPALNELYQFVGKARVEYTAFDKDVDAWIANSSVSQLHSYKDLMIDDSTVPAVGDDNITQNGVTLTKVENYTCVYPNFSNCTFQLNAETKKQLVGITDYYYNRTDEEQSKFTLGSPVSANFSGPNSVTFTTTLDKGETDTEYYYKIPGTNSYGKVKWKCDVGFFQATFTLIYYTDAGNTKTIEKSGKYDWSAVKYDCTFDNLYTLDEISDIASGKYLVVTGSNAVGDNSVTASISGVDSFRQRDNLYNFVYDGTSSRVINVVSNTRYSVSSAVTHPANFYSSPALTYTVGNLSVNGVTAFELHALTEEASDPKLVFTRLEDTKYNSQFIIMEDVNPPETTE